jgi:hypothetical protein
MKTMEPQTLRDALERWGPDLALWPPATAAAAQLLLAESAAARSELAAAQRLQELLDALPLITAPPALKRSIIATPSSDRWQPLLQWLTGARWRPTLAAALSMTLAVLLGFSLGFTTVSREPVPDLDPLADVSLLAFLGSYEDYPNE